MVFSCKVVFLASRSFHCIGYIVYSGAIITDEGKEKKIQIAFEPPGKVKKIDFNFDSKFDWYRFYSLLDMIEFFFYSFVLVQTFLKC